MPIVSPPGDLETEANDDTLPRGATVGRYVIVDVIGRGGMGVVYAAYDTQLDRKIAIKLLRPDLVSGLAATEIETRLLREAQAMARLSHPNVVTVHDVGAFEHRVFLAMEFIDGTTLKGWLAAKPRSLRERLDVLRAAGRGLAAAHAAGLVHRDFKPDNVLVGHDGRVLVTDFGLARADGDTSPEEPLPLRPEGRNSSGVGRREPSSLDVRLTETGNVIGTVGYLAPEQAFGEGTSAATDQFSYAVTAYYILYGERPFPADSLEDYLKAVDRPVPDPRKGEKVPSWIRRILLRGMSPEKEARFSSLDDLLSALENDPVRRWRRIGASLGIVLLITLSGIAVVSNLRQRAAVCAIDATELAPVWGPNIAENVHRAFEATGVPEARDAADRLSRRIDLYVQRWAEMRSLVCRSTRVTKTQSEDVYRLRMDCLERQRTELQSVSSMLVNADSQVVRKAIDIAYGLPDVAWCENVATLRASAGLPDDPLKRAKVVELRTRLAEVKSLHLSGKDEAEAALAHAATQSALLINHLPTTAEALFVEGVAQQSLGGYSESYPLLREATWASISSGSDATAVRAASFLAFVVGAKLGRIPEAHIWLEAARAALARIGPTANELLELDILDKEADVMAEGELRPEKSIPIQERVTAGYRRLLGVSPTTETAIYNLAVYHGYVGELHEARALYEEALRMTQLLSGPASNSAAITQYALGECLVGLGELPAGEAMLTSSVAVFEKSAAPYWIATTLEVLVRARLVAGDTSGALEYAQRALALADNIHDTSDLLASIDVSTAETLNALGRFKDALPLCESALAIEEKGSEIDPEKTYGWDALRCKAESLMGLGRASEALPLLERSLTLKRRMYPGDHARAEFALARALRILRSDPKRGAELAASARADMGRYTHLKWEIARIDAFLADSRR